MQLQHGPRSKPSGRFHNCYISLFYFFVFLFYFVESQWDRDPSQRRVTQEPGISIIFLFLGVFLLLFFHFLLFRFTNAGHGISLSLSTHRTIWNHFLRISHKFNSRRFRTLVENAMDIETRAMHVNRIWN